MPRHSALPGATSSREEDPPGSQTSPFGRALCVLAVILAAAYVLTYGRCFHKEKAEPDNGGCTLARQPRDGALSGRRFARCQDHWLATAPRPARPSRFCLSTTAPGNVHRWLLLAWLPPALSHAPVKPGLLGTENQQERGPRPREHQVLRRAGWRVLRIWGHSLRAPDVVIRRIISRLRLADNGANNQGNERTTGKNHSGVLRRNWSRAHRPRERRLAHRLRQ